MEEQDSKPVHEGVDSALPAREGAPSSEGEVEPGASDAKGSEGYRAAGEATPPRPGDSITRVSTVLIAVATVVYVIVSSLQWGAIRESNRLTRESNRLAREAFRIEKRASLRAIGASPWPYAPVADTPGVVWVTIRNAGSADVEANFYGEAHVGSYALATERGYTYFFPGAKPPFAKFLPPASQFNFDVFVPPMDASTVAKILDPSNRPGDPSQLWLFVYGYATYDDRVVGEQGMRWFCYYLWPGAGWQECPNNNDGTAFGNRRE